MEPKKMKVAIWDDREDQLAALLASIQSGVAGIEDLEIVECTPAEIASCVNELNSRFKLNSSDPLPFLDDIDVLCIDYDLRMLEGQTWLTADVLAGLVRAYSDCPTVVAMNRPPRVAFDLTMTGGWEGPGDIQVIPASLSRDTFWRDIRPNGPDISFRPWSWFDLREARTLMSRRISELEGIEDLESQDIFRFFDFGREEILDFSWRALGSLSGKVKNEEPRLSFGEFLLDGVRCLPPEKMRDTKLSDPSTRPIALRILAFELGRWLSEQVLAGQDVLVDLPHLFSRAPWLLPGERSASETWNGSLSNAFKAPTWLTEHEFKRKSWLNRRAYVWSSVQSDSRFPPPGHSDATNASLPDYGNFVFLEDASCFVAPDQAQEFTASFGNVWDQRYVRRSDLLEVDLPYGPLVRFAV